MAHLTIRSPAHARRRVPIGGDVFRIGRASDNDLALDDWKVAEYHGELVRDAGDYRLRVLDPDSATRINAEPVVDRPLRSGDELRIGETVLEFRADEDEGGLAELRLPVDAFDATVPTGSAALERERFALLYQVGKKVLSATSIGDLNDLALSLVFDCVKAERGALLLEDPETGQFQARLLRHRDGRQLSEDELKVPTSIVREATMQRVGILTSDALLDERFKARESVRVGLVRSALCAPLWYEGEVLGVIYLDSQIQSYAFTREDLVLLSAVANLIAIRLRQEDLNAEATEQRVLRSNLERYHSPEVVERILAQTREGRSASVGLEERDVTVFFADIAGFTPLAERLAPAVVADILNAYYAVATEAIFAHGGTVNEFVGDSVLAIFGAPTAHEDHADRAVRAGLALLEGLEGRAEIAVRVAINSGPAMVGTVGPPNRLKYAVVGDAVNVAARLERIGEPGALTIGDETHRRLRQQVVAEDLGPLQLRGRAGAIRAHRIRPPRKG